MKDFIGTLPGVFDAIEASDDARQAFVFAAWRKVAGEQVFDRTSPLAVDNGRLVIAVSDKTWKRNLETLAPQLLFKLNAALGKPLVDYLVDYIEFHIAPDKVELTDRNRSKVNNSETPPPPVEVSVSSRRIRDEALRETVLKAAANCLARQK